MTQIPTEEMKRVLSDLRGLRNRVCEIADRLQEQISAMNEQLQQIAPPLPVMVEISDEYGWLHWGKPGSKWGKDRSFCLCIEKRDSRYPEIRPCDHLPIKERLFVFQHLPELLLKMRQEADVFVCAAQEVID